MIDELEKILHFIEYSLKSRIDANKTVLIYNRFATPHTGKTIQPTNCGTCNSKSLTISAHYVREELKKLKEDIQPLEDCKDCPPSLVQTVELQEVKKTSNRRKKKSE